MPLSKQEISAQAYKDLEMLEGLMSKNPTKRREDLSIAKSVLLVMSNERKKAIADLIGQIRETVDKEIKLSISEKDILRAISGLGEPIQKRPTKNEVKKQLKEIDPTDIDKALENLDPNS